MLRSRIAEIKKPVPHFVKKPFAFRLDIIKRRIIRLRRITHLFARLEDMLTDESDEFCSIIRLGTEFILGTNYPSETDNQTDNPSRLIIRLLM